MKNVSKAELIMHPIRFRILMALSGRRLTTRQVVQALPDISQASVYRHLQVLWKAGLLCVVEEVPVRGVVERVYAYTEDESMLSRDDTQHWTNDDYLRYFHLFVNSLLDQFRLYIQSEDARPREDGIAHWTDAVYLSREERGEMLAELVEATRKRMNNPPSPERERFTVSRILIPDNSETNGSDKA